MQKLSIYVLLSVLLSCNSTMTVKQETEAIHKILFKSAEDWSNGDLEAFMGAYWKSDSLQFIGKSGITYGWHQTLDNYKKGYPDRDHTGKLTFKILETDRLASDLYSVVGTFHLNRKVGDANGIFTLIIKKIAGNWVIISDHSS